MNPQPLQLLLVEDDPTDARAVREALQKELDVPYQLIHAERLSEALNNLRQAPVDIVLLDLQLPDSQGLDGISQVRAVSATVPIVVLTASDDDGLAIQSLQLGAQDYLVKGYIQVYRNLLRRSVRYAIERGAAERELLQAHRHTEHVLSSITSLLIGVNENGFITHWNSVAESTFGADAQEMMGCSLSDERIRWETARILRALADCRLAGQTTKIEDVIFKRTTGNEGLLGITITPMRDAQDHVEGFLVLGADVTDRKLAQEALRESEARYRSVIAAMAEGVVLQDDEGRIRTCNKSAERILGLTTEALKDRTLWEAGWEAIHEDGSPFPSEAHPTKMTLQTAKPCTNVVMGIHKPDRSLVWISVNSQPLFRPGNTKPSAVVTSFSEITDRKRAEAEQIQLQNQLDQAQKMETVGRFAGGIAHDFENFLQVILGFAWMIRSRHKDDAELLNDLQEIVHAAESASGMVRQLLAFSRRQALKPTVLEMNRTIEQMEKILQQLVGDAVRLVLDLAEEPLLVKLDPTAFEQIVMNLCSNARDSMRQGGTLTIRSKLIIADEAFREAHPAITAAGPMVRLSVSDTGQGIDPEVAAHIFEPFFTTKRSGQGTGLGLAVVYGLVKQHDGYVDVETAHGKGTTFHVYVASQTIGSGASRAQQQAGAAASGKTARVLIGDDDEKQRTLVTGIFKELGYDVVGAIGEKNILTGLAGVSPRPQLLVLNNSAIEGDGVAFIRQLRERVAGLKVLIVSSRRDERLRLLAETLPGVQLLRTPFMPSQLSESLKLLFEARVSQNKPAAQPSAPADVRPKLLIVDDEESIRKLCRRILESSCEVMTAGSGQEAIATLNTVSYDLLVTDLKMPEMDGFELIEQAIKRRPSLKVLAISGLVTPDMEKRLRSGPAVCDLLRKPFTATALEQAVKRCL